MKTRSSIAFLTVIAIHLVAGFIARAAVGDLDRSFDPGSMLDNEITGLALQPDGKILIIGYFAQARGVPRAGIARLNSDGTGDSSFDPGSGFNLAPKAVALQSDGRLVVAGSFSSFNGTPRNQVVRLNPDGSLDKTFELAMSPDDLIECVALQPDGKVILGGAFSHIGNLTRNRVARLNTDGSLDANFASSLYADGRTYAIAVQSDGNILIGGTFSVVGGILQSGIARLNQFGNPDQSFVPPAATNRVVRSIGLQADGRILVAGRLGGPNLVRLNTDGTLDNTFAGTIDPTKDAVSVLVRPDGRAVCGWQPAQNPTELLPCGVARLNSDGTPDPTFSQPALSNTFVLSMALQGDGKVLASGEGIERLNADGSSDTAFQTRTGPNSFVNAAVQQEDGKLLVGGAFFQVDNDLSRLHAHIARFNRDGSLDPSFDPGPGFYPGPGPDAAVESLALQPDGKILIGGIFTNVSRTLHQGVARLNSNGQLDSTFDVALEGVHPSVHSLCLQPDNKIIIGGEFASIHNTACDGIARLNEDGTLDSSFNAHPGYVIWNIRSTVLQPDGKLLIGGFFDFPSATRHSIARLNTNGTLDATFDPGTGTVFGTVNSMALQGDGKVLLAGDFTQVNGATRMRVARLDSNGSLDPTFDPGAGPDGTVNCLALQPDGQMLIGGGFSTMSGLKHPFLARLDSSGTLDSTFAPAGPNAPVTCLLLTTAGQFYTGGRFTLMNDISRGYVARMFFDTPPPFRFQNAMVLTDKSLQLTLSAPSASSVRIEASTNLVSWTTLTNVSVPLSGSVQFVDQEAASLKTRYYRGVSF